MSAFEVVIGLEVHAQLLTRSKVFCTAANNTRASENTQVGPVSLGLPGALPVLNQQAVLLAVRAGVALNCQIRERSLFARKNYFYPDSPKGYQISQFDAPICFEGQLEIDLPDLKKTIGIERIHIEDDAGRLLHVGDSTLINLNRSGVPLIEIVSKPDMRSAAEAVAYLKKLHSILVYTDVCDGNLEEGNFRCDVNVSVRPWGQKTLGTRSELKNINSFRFVEKAIEYETARHVAVIQSGAKIIQETRGWDAAAGKTFSMRTKEEAADYRYFPDPDLPPLKLDPKWIEQIRQDLPELPQAMKLRFIQGYELQEVDAEVLTSDKAVAFYFEQSVKAGAKPKTAANWIMSEVLREWHERGGSLADFVVGPKDLAQLLELVESGKISGKIAKQVLIEMVQGGQSAEQIVQAKGYLQVSDTSSLESWVDQVINANPDQVAQLKAGKEKVMAFLVGQIMKLSKGQANPALVSELLKRKTS